MKKLAKVFAVSAAILLLFALLVGALYRIFTDKEWVRKEYGRIGIEAQSGYTVDQAAYVLGAMMDYSMGFIDGLGDVSVEENGASVRFFNERELSHMVDVRALTGRFMRLGLAALILGLALFAASFLILKSEGIVFFSKAFLIVLGVLAALIAAIGIWMAVDFNSFWLRFHEVFLDLESSYFSWNESRMIRICPAELFSDFIKHFALIAGLGLIAPVSVSAVMLFLRKRLKGDERSPRFAIVYLLSSAVIVCLITNIVTGIEPFRIVGMTGLLAVSVLNIINARQSRKDPS